MIIDVHVFVSVHLLQSWSFKKAQLKPTSENAENCTMFRMFSGLFITATKVLSEDSGVKPKNISCINPCQGADYSQTVLQAATNWKVQLLADKAITSVILAPSLRKSASNPLRFWSISLPSDEYKHRKAATVLIWKMSCYHLFWPFFFF